MRSFGKSSWVITDKETGEIIFETFSEATAIAIRRDKFKVTPILEHLQSLNVKNRKD
jgi:hypothetical protein